MDDQRRQLDWGELDRSLMPDDEPDFPTPALDDKMLPPNIWRVCCALADYKNCPVDYVVAGLLSAAAGVIGFRRKCVATAEWIEATILWTMVVGPSGIKKSPVRDYFRDIIVELERELEDEWRRNGHDEDEKPPRMRFDNATLESLMRVLSRNPFGLWGGFDELSSWFTSFNQYKGGKGRDRGDWLSLYKGEKNYYVDRVSNSFSVPWAGCSITGNITQGAARETVEESQGDGMAERFLYFYPSRPPAKRASDPSPENAQRLKHEMMRALRKLRDLKCDPIDEGGPGRVLMTDPTIVELTSPAKDRFFTIDLEMQNREDAGDFINGWRLKSAGRILRLSLVFKFLEWALRTGNEPGLIDTGTVEKAARFINEYAEPMARKVAGGLSLSNDEKVAVKVVEYIVREGGMGRVINRTEIGRSHVKALRKTGVADRVFAILQKKNYVRPVVTAMGKPRNDWAVNPQVFE
jgi:hypothetical protein